jgi:hypothetical protein
MDTTDLSKSLLFYYTLTGVPGLPDMEYPRNKLAQKLDLFVTTQYFTQWNAFSVKFNPTLPSFYTTTWDKPGVHMTLYSSSDSTGLNPQALLSSLNSKLLKGKDISGLSLSGFHFERLGGLDYAGSLSYTHSPARIKTIRLPSAVTYTKRF